VDLSQTGVRSGAPSRHIQHIEEQINLLKLALQWLQLAENEEFMALHHQRANDN